MINLNQGKEIINRLYSIYLEPIILSEKNVECPFCKWQGKNFLSYGVKKRKNAQCPKCGSLERHRLYYLYLKNIIPKNKKIKVLHFAPEKILSNLFKSFNNIEYLSADLNPKKAMIKQDITKITLKDNTFDIIFCSHVLEHIEDDIKAMKEIYRVLNLEGFAILQVPIEEDRNETYENSSLTTERERLKAFGQKDHVRIYGKDYKKRLEKAGFKVKIENFFNTLDPQVIKKFGLVEENIYFCTKI